MTQDKRLGNKGATQGDTTQGQGKGTYQQRGNRMKKGGFRWVEMPISAV